ncbi:MAG: hypothetical protein NTW86_26425 [Candidatus Sumerlaeota bacterium]|nr:hypothetical protein [Candidatus Sumerlaeota bacterium]
MADLLIKRVPLDVHARLKAEAKKHRRSLTQEVLVILERSFAAGTADFPEPVQGRRPLNQRLVTKGIQEGRA